MVSRYFSYFIQFVNSVLIAKYLGPYYLGVWGFITLIIQYLNQFNLGISHSVNALISVNKNKKKYVEKVIGTSVFMTLILSALILLFFFITNFLDIKIGQKFQFHQYIYIVAFVGILGYFNSLFSTISRVNGNVFEIAFNQSSLPVFMFLALVFFNKGNLINALIGAYLIAFILSFLVYVFKGDFSIKPLCIAKLIKEIQLKGFYLFIYNTSFYLIIIVTRSFISEYYSVVEFGYFTFAYTFANVALLLLQSFSFLIFPKLINRFSKSSMEETGSLLSMVRKNYIVGAHFLIHLFIFLFPFFVMFFPKYGNATGVFRLIALSVVLYANSFGYTGLLIAKKQEKSLSLIAFVSLLLNTLLLYLFIVFFNVEFNVAVLATMLSNMLFVFLIGYKSMPQLYSTYKLPQVIREVFPLSLFLPYIMSLVFVVLDLTPYYFILPVILLVVFNYKVIFDMIKLGKKVINDPNIINI